MQIYQPEGGGNWSIAATLANILHLYPPPTSLHNVLGHINYCLLQFSQPPGIKLIRLNYGNY